MPPLSPTHFPTTTQPLELLFSGEIEKLCEKEASFFDDDHSVSTTASSESLASLAIPVSIDAKTKEVILDNILRLIRRHKTKPEQLVYWCERSSLTIAKLLNNTHFDSQAVEKIAEYYHVTLKELASPEFPHKTFEHAHPMSESVIDEKKAKLLRIGKRITALCQLGEVTDKELAECCRCDERAISEIKKGLYPNFILIDKIAKMCKTMTNELANPNVSLPERSHAQQDAEHPSAKDSQECTAANICLLMQHHKVTRTMLAKWCKCSTSTISKAKNGSAHFSAVIEKIANFFHLTVKQLAAKDFAEKHLAASSTSK